LILVLGAGPAGLTAAWELQRLGRTCTVLEQEAVVGGLSRTVEQGGFLFDIGGHRFYTRSRLVEKIWKDLLGEDLLTRNRISRIFYRGHFFQYPLDLRNVIAGLGLPEILRCAGSYASGPIGQRTISKPGSGTDSGGDSMTFSSAPTPKKSGACHVRASRLNGRRSVSGG